MTKVAANSSLTIKKEYEFVLDYANLNNIYGSIIGNDAINTYCLLVNEALNSNRLEKKQDLFKFLNRLG
jgi:replication initiation and membrane attachment protein DnaB